mgnify:CR=1 FL=1
MTLNTRHGLKAGIMVLMCLMVSSQAWSAANLGAANPGVMLKDVETTSPQPKASIPTFSMPNRPPMNAPVGSMKLALTRFNITGNTVFSSQSLNHLIADMAGTRVAFADMLRAANRITNFYRDAGYLVARAYIPEQEIQEGVIEIAVLEGLIGTVNVDNQAGLSNGLVGRHIRVMESGTVVSRKNVERAMLLLNDLPGVDASATFKVGKEEGRTDLDVDLKRARRVSGSVDLNNFGSEFTGEARLGVALNINNTFGVGDSLGLRVLGSENSVTLSGGTDNDDIIDVDGNVTSGGALTVQNAVSADLAANVNLQGTSVTASSGVTAINLSGAGTNVATSTAGAVDLAAVVDAASANLTVTSEAGATLAGVVLDAGGAGVLDINLDTDGDGADNLDVNGDIDVTTLTVDGTAATGSETVSLAGNVDITAAAGGVSMATANNIASIDLDGAGTNIITATGDANVALAAVTDSAAANLTVAAEGGVTLDGATLDTGGAGAITVTVDSDDDAGAATLLLAGAVSTTGAVTFAGTSADDTIDLDFGITSTGAGISLSTVNAIQVANVTVDAQGGDLTVGAPVNLDGTGTQTATFSTTNADSDVTIAAITSAANQSVAVNSTGAATLGGVINLGTGDLTASVDTDDDAGVTETLAIDNTVAADDVILAAGDIATGNSRSNITQTAVITSTTLSASATNGITLTQNNVVPTVTLNNVSAGNIQYNSAAGATLTVSGANTASAGTVSVTEAANGITVAAAGLASNGGTLSLTTIAGQLITLTGAVASNSSTPAGANITLTAEDMDLTGTINAGTGGTVTLVQTTAGDAVDLGAADTLANNVLELTTAETTGITASRLLIGAATAGAITVSSDVSILNVATTHLTTGSTVTGTAGGIVANDLAINAGGAVNMTDASSNVDNLAVAAAGFDVTFTEADGFEVDTVDGVTGITGAAITLTTGGDLGIVEAITATGNVINTAAGSITQNAAIDVATSGGSITYLADSDNSGTGAVTMGADAGIETAGTAGANISLTAGTAANGGQDITLADVDAGTDGNVTVQTFAGSIRDDGRDSSTITGDTITLTAAGDVGGTAAFTIAGSKSEALEITVTGLTGITSTATAGHNQLMVVDSALLDVEDMLSGLAGTGMTGGTQKQLFVGALDGAMVVNTAIDLTGTNNDLFLFTGGENRDINVNANISANRDDTDTTIQRAVIIQSSGDITQLDTTRIKAFDVVADAPTGSVKIYTGTDLLEATGGQDQDVFIDNVTPVASKFTDPAGNDTTRMLNDIITSGSGTITIVNDGSLTVDQVVQTTGTGDISISATGGNSPLYITSEIDSGGDVTLSSAGDLAADGVYIQDGGSIQSGALNTSGTVTITSNDNVHMDATAVILTLASGANGKITITADSNGDVSGTGTGEITMVSGARVTASGGAEIDVDAGGDITLGELNAGVVARGDVTVDSTGGSIADANGVALNIEGDDVSMSASGGISADIIPAGNVTLDSTVAGANGDIDVTSLLGSLNVVTASAGTGTVVLVAEDGGITDQNLAGVTNITGGAVSLTASSIIDTDVAASTSVAVMIQDAGGTAQDGNVTLRSPIGLRSVRSMQVAGT